MKTRKMVLLTAISLIFCQGFVAQAGELATSSNSQSGATVKIGKVAWSNGLCKVVQEGNKLGKIIIPMSRAIRDCPRLLDYGKVEEAYTPCSEIILKELDPNQNNSKCLTKKGYQFQIVRVGAGLGIKDLSKNGKIWFFVDQIKTGISQQDSVKYCEEKGQALPSRKDFENAEKHGFREAFSSDMKGKYLWSSLVYPNYDSIAFYFNGNNGDIGYDNRNGYYTGGGVRCVSASGVGR